jgi:undecaprenyl-diphosphatase
MFKKIVILDEKIHNHLSKYSNNIILSIIARTGNFAVITIILIILIINEDTSNAGIISIAGLILSTLIVFILKYSIKRKRISTDNFIKIDPYSFPSGHISRLAVFIITGDSFVLLPIFLIITIASSIARISKGYHYLSDCIIGFIVGIISGITALLLKDYYLNLIYELIKKLLVF